MKIILIAPVHPIDVYAMRGFIEIINTILIAEHAADLFKRLMTTNVKREYRRMTGYYIWEFSDSSFSLWQRIDYDSPVYFKDKIPEVPYLEILHNNQGGQDTSAS